MGGVVASKRRNRGTGVRSVPRFVVALAGVAVLAAGCAVPSPNGEGAGDTAPPATQPPQGAKGLDRYYTQQVAWEGCGDADADGGNAQCAWVEVPVDYEKPAEGTIKLRMLKVAASGSPQGALLVNPGGPGGSAVEYARAADLIVSPSVRRRFDVVGVDPRGVGESSPVQCVDGPQMDAIMGLDPTPDDAKEREATRMSAKAFGEACEKKYPQLLPHLSTVDAARDMDVVRAVLGQQKLSYLGKSYGTFLGATYAGLFPTRVGSMVLDGAIAPELSNDELNLGQAVGFETATRAYVKSCVSEGDCPLGSGVDEGMEGLRDLLAKIDEKPVPVTDDARVEELTEGWASTGLARALYDQASWEGLTDALRAAKEGDGDQLMQLAREYADRDETGAYHGNIMQVISAINCLDRPAEAVDDAAMQARVEKFEKASPTWGESMAMATVSCEEWPVDPKTEPQKISASGSGPIVVVGTTRDPATPYEWAQKLASQLENGHLVTFEGDGHTAYMRSNACVDKAVDSYLLKGTVPKDGLTC
ncbi:peptidase S33 family protein [Mobilicoccus pelagius NBRC 104925]|uniref:Peptidase S33 family protein n=1 Tax=Mobilicoccus pelagius NBRC 104925 TaxID=1089455 RepID=H5UNZ6_9MICO|nr:peptidase S33 family protein [Mobilicoccus pelagius NBRC 104925]